MSIFDIPKSLALGLKITHVFGKAFRNATKGIASEVEKDLVHALTNALQENERANKPENERGKTE